MKKIIGIFSLVLIVTLSQAQTVDKTTVPATTNVIESQDQEKVVPASSVNTSDTKHKGCSKVCTPEQKASASSGAAMSAEHTSAGAIASDPSVNNKKSEKKSCGASSSSCCQGKSKASAVVTPAPENPATGSVPRK